VQQLCSKYDAAFVALVYKRAIAIYHKKAEHDGLFKRGTWTPKGLTVYGNLVSAFDRLWKLPGNDILYPIVCDVKGDSDDSLGDADMEENEFE